MYLSRPGRPGYRLGHVCMGTSQATHPIPRGFMPTRAHAVPGFMETHETTWRTTACAWAGACLGRAWPHMGPWHRAQYLLARASMAACGHALMTCMETYVWLVWLHEGMITHGADTRSSMQILVVWKRLQHRCQLSVDNNHGNLNLAIFVADCQSKRPL